MIRVVLKEEEFTQLLEQGETETDGIKFVLEGKSAMNTVSVDRSDFNDIIEGRVVSTQDGHHLDIEYCLSDIGYKKIFELITKHKIEWKN